MVYNDGRPHAQAARSSCAYSCYAGWEGDNCNGGGVVAAASMSAPTMSPPTSVRAHLLIKCVHECVPISRAALER